MQLNWKIEENDTTEIQRFINQLSSKNNSLMEKRIRKNINGHEVQLSKDEILKSMMICLLTSQQRSGPKTRVGIFARKEPFPIDYKLIKDSDDVSSVVKKILTQNDLNRYINRIAVFFEYNFKKIEKSDWKLFSILNSLKGNKEKYLERSIADSLADDFKGFGPKQSRNFLQMLGLTKFEIPLDSRVMRWLNDFGFPIKLSGKALSDINYYHFALDGIQELCEKAEIYPCVLDAAIFSSYDGEQWNNKEN